MSKVFASAPLLKPPARPKKARKAWGQYGVIAKQKRDIAHLLRQNAELSAANDALRMELGRVNREYAALEKLLTDLSESS
jgi:hypothetical protein